MSSHIVVVEDEPELLEMLCHALEEEGFAVTSFDLPDLNRIVLENTPSVFLIDLMLPRLTGVELAALLRLKGYSDSAMIAMSASSIELRLALNSHLFQEVLSKPFDLRELVGCMKRYVA